MAVCQYISLYTFAYLIGSSFRLLPNEKKNVDNKKCAPKLITYSTMKKKEEEKGSDSFWCMQKIDFER